MQLHQQQAAVCERSMIYKAGQMDMLNKMLAPAAPDAPTSTAPSAEPAQAMT